MMPCLPSWAISSSSFTLSLRCVFGLLDVPRLVFVAVVAFENVLDVLQLAATSGEEDHVEAVNLAAIVAVLVQQVEQRHHRSVVAGLRVNEPVAVAVLAVVDQ